MDKIFKDPLAVKSKSNGRAPWSTLKMSKDIAHGGFLSQGDNYGTGRRAPVGKEKSGSYASGPVPMKSQSFSADEIFRGEDKKG